jgi:hypothetical protein
MRKLRVRHRGRIEDAEAGLDRYETPPNKRFWRSGETFNSYEEREAVYDHDLRSPKVRFAGDVRSHKSTSDD